MNSVRLCLLPAMPYSASTVDIGQPSVSSIHKRMKRYPVIVSVEVYLPARRAVGYVMHGSVSSSSCSQLDGDSTVGGNAAVSFQWSIGGKVATGSSLSV